MINEFRKFILRGNAIDLAVGIVIGAAFTAIVNSLVNDLINPIIGVLIGGVDFSSIVIPLRYADDGTIAAGLYIGRFINAIIQFLIVGFAMFLIVRAVNAAQELRPERLPGFKEAAGLLGRREVPLPAPLPPSTAVIPAVPAPSAPSNDQLLLEAINKLNATLEKRLK